MGGNNKQKNSSSSFSLMSLFKPQKARRDNALEVDSVSSGKIYPSDYDKGRYVAEPGIDKKATVFIDKFHKTHVSESERQVIAGRHVAEPGIDKKATVFIDKFHKTHVSESERQVIAV